MQYGICPLSIVPLRAEPKNTSEQTSQLLYGEFFTVFDTRKSWSKIQNESDGYEGWLNNKHFLLIEKANFEKYLGEVPKTKNENGMMVTTACSQATS